jgi:hypothetical protein
MAVQNPPVKGGFEPPVMFFSAVVILSKERKKYNRDNFYKL